MLPVNPLNKEIMQDFEGRVLKANADEQLEKMRNVSGHDDLSAFPLFEMKKIFDSLPSLASHTEKSFWQELKMPDCEMHLKFWKKLIPDQSLPQFRNVVVDKWTDERGLICEGMRIHGTKTMHGLVRVLNPGKNTRSLFEPRISQRSYKDGQPHGLWMTINDDVCIVYLKKNGKTVATMTFDRLFTETKRDDQHRFLIHMDPSEFKRDEAAKERVRVQPRTNFSVHPQVKLNLQSTEEPVDEKLVNDETVFKLGFNTRTIMGPAHKRAVSDAWPKPVNGSILPPDFHGDYKA